MKPHEDSVLICAGAVQLAPTATGTMMYMPGGLQTIRPIGGALKNADDSTMAITVKVDAAGAAALNAQHAALVARGKRPYFDFNHEDGPASFWPESFFWSESPEPGIYAKGEWTGRGRESVEGREWRQFSPVFHVSKKRGATPQNPAAIVCREWAKPNMGGLVNDPAFHAIAPLWARDGSHSSGAAGEPNHNQNAEHMNEQELAALRAKNQELENELTALRAKNDDAAAISAKAAELRAVKAEIAAEESRKEMTALKAKNDANEAALKARNAADAKAAVQRAVSRNAIAPKDTKTQEALVAKATEDPLFCSVIDAMQGAALSGRITPSGSGVSIVAEAPTATLKAFTALIARNAGVRLSHETAKEKGQLAREAAAIFAKDIETNPLLSDITIDEAIRAADVTDTNVGLLAGTLVLQRALPLMQYEYPLLSLVTADYSDAPGLFGQTESTRILVRPAVQTYNSALDSAGRPIGWDTASKAQAVDVSITLDEHIGVPIVFGVQTLAKTVRNLFAEQVPLTLNAIGGYATDKLTALMTATNFNAYKGNTLSGGATTNGSAAITFSSSTNIYPGQEISGTGIPAKTYVASVTSATAAVLTQKATADGSSLTFTLNGGRVPTAYTTYVKALADFDVASMGEVKTAFDLNQVPMSERFALLSSSYHNKLANTPTLNSFFAATRKPEIITAGDLPPVQGFAPSNAPWFPTSSNRVGFFGHKASLMFKTRLPQDFTQAVGAMVPGSVTTVTAPGGISVLLVQYVNLQGNYAEWRPEVMLGAAVGDRRAGLVATSQ